MIKTLIKSCRGWLVPAFLLLASPAFAAPPAPIHFTPGTSSGKVSGAVIRGERDFYSLGAKAGQKMTVTIKALEDNAVFQIYQPGVDRKPLPGADGDTTSWTGKLPSSGSYLIEVGGTRGNATYELNVSIE